MHNQSEQHSHILFTGPGGWTYYAWSEDGRLPSTSVEDLSDELNIDVDKEKLLDGDDVESFRVFVHVIAEISKKHGFTHLVDEEMDILIDEPKPIIEVGNDSLKGWPTGAQLRVLKGLDLAHLAPVVR